MKRSLPFLTFVFVLAVYAGTLGSAVGQDDRDHAASLSLSDTQPRRIRTAQDIAWENVRRRDSLAAYAYFATFRYRQGRYTVTACREAIKRWGGFESWADLRYARDAVHLVRNWHREDPVPWLVQAFEDPNPVVRFEAFQLRHELDPSWWLRQRQPGLWEEIATGGALEALLAHEDQYVREATARILARCPHHQPLVDRLIATLKTRRHAAWEDQSWAVSRAVEALGILGDRRAVEPLVALMRSNPGAAGDAAAALAAIGDPRAIEPLILALECERQHVDAARALARFHDDRVVEPLLEALKKSESDPWMIRDTAVALARSGDPKTVQPLLDALNRQTAMLNRLISEGQEVAFDPPQERMAYALGELRDPRAVEPLIAVLRTKLTRKTLDAPDALTKLGAPAVPALLRLLRDPNAKDAKFCACHALENISDPEAIPSLASAVDDADPAIQLAVVYALGRTKDPRAGAPLEKVMRDEDRQLEVRQAACRMLSRVTKPEDRASVMACLDDPNLRDSATISLSLAGDRRAIEPSIDRLKRGDNSARMFAAMYLGEFRDPRAAAPLAAAVEDPDGSVRVYATVALGLVGGPQATPALQRVLMAGEDCHWAGEMLLLQGDPGLEALRTAVKQGGRRSAATAAGMLGEESGRPGLEAALRYAREAKSHTSLLYLLRAGSRPQNTAEVARALVWDANHVFERRETEPLLLALWPHTKTVLLEYLRSDDAADRELAAKVAMRLDRDELKPELLAALRERGTEGFAHHLTRTFDETLSEAGETWLREHKEKE